MDMYGSGPAAQEVGECPCKQYTRILYAVVLVLLFLIVLGWWFHGECLTGGGPGVGGYLGSGVTDNVYTSGATMRRLGQVFSSTDQGSSDYVSNDELRGTLLPTNAQNARRATERYTVGPRVKAAPVRRAAVPTVAQAFAPYERMTASVVRGMGPYDELARGERLTVGRAAQNKQIAKYAAANPVGGALAKAVFVPYS
jgi:hypothetical protein